MKRLIKKAEHDIMNRDSAIVYAGGKFYTASTHSLCLKKIKDENKEIKVVLRSYQMRADIDQFMEISKIVGPIVVAHHVKKEDGVFIDYGIIDGTAVYFDDIPDSIKNEFRNEFNLEVYDELKHDTDIYRNPEKNPYKDEAKELGRQMLREVNKQQDPTEAKKYLQDHGFRAVEYMWVDKNDTISVELNDAMALIYPIGCEEMRCQIDEVPEVLDNFKNNFLEKMEKYIKDYHCYYDEYDKYEINFENNNGIDVTIRVVGDYKFDVEPYDLHCCLPEEFYIESLDECMEYIMDWKPEEDTKNNNEQEDDDINYDSILLDDPELLEELDFDL